MCMQPKTQLALTYFWTKKGHFCMSRFGKVCRYVPKAMLRLKCPLLQFIQPSNYIVRSDIASCYLLKYQQIAYLLSTSNPPLFCELQQRSYPCENDCVSKYTHLGDSKP